MFSCWGYLQGRYLVCDCPQTLVPCNRSVEQIQRILAVSSQGFLVYNLLWFFFQQTKKLKRTWVPYNVLSDAIWTFRLFDDVTANSIFFKFYLRDIFKYSLSLRRQPLHLILHPCSLLSAFSLVLLQLWQACATEVMIASSISVISKGASLSRALTGYTWEQEKAILLVFTTVAEPSVVG